MDDERLLGAMMSDCFKEQGFRVLTARNAEVAILKNSRFYAVVSDIRMPKPT